MLRATFYIMAVGGFAGLAVVDLLVGRYSVGAASLCLALANALLLRG